MANKKKPQQWPKIKHPGLSDEDAEKRLQRLVDHWGGLDKVTLEQAIEEIGFWNTMITLWKWDGEKR